MIWPSSATRFAAVDDPLQPRRKVAEMHWRELGLDAQTVHDGGDREQFRYIPLETGLIDRYEQPHIRITSAPILGQHFGRVADTLRQNDPIELGRLTNERPQPVAHRLIDLIVENIGHRRAKDAMTATLCLRRVLPCQWLTPVRTAEIAARSARPPVRPLVPPSVEHHRIAVVAKRAYLRAPPPGIKGVVAPGDFRDRAHRATFITLLPVPRQSAPNQRP